MAGGSSESRDNERLLAQCARPLGIVRTLANIRRFRTARSRAKQVHHVSQSAFVARRLRDAWVNDRRDVQERSVRRDQITDRQHRPTFVCPRINRPTARPSPSQLAARFPNEIATRGYGFTAENVCNRARAVSGIHLQVSHDRPNQARDLSNARRDEGEWIRSHRDIHSLERHHLAVGRNAGQAIPEFPIVGLLDERTSAAVADAVLRLPRVFTGRPVVRPAHNSSLTDRCFRPRATVPSQPGYCSARARSRPFALL